MFDRFVKWIKCPACVRTTLTGLKALLVAVGPTAIALSQQLGYHPGEVEKGVGMVLSVVGAVLLIMEKTSASVVKEAREIEGVQVHVDTTRDPNTGEPTMAPASVVKLAEGSTPDVFPMRGGPRVPTEHNT